VIEEGPRRTKAAVDWLLWPSQEVGSAKQVEFLFFDAVFGFPAGTV